MYDIDAFIKIYYRNILVNKVNDINMLITILL